MRGQPPARSRFSWRMLRRSTLVLRPNLVLLPTLFPLLAAGMAWSQAQHLEPVSGPLPEPLRPNPAQLSHQAPARFDASLDALVRDGVVTPSERSRIRSGGGMMPFNVPAHQQACRSGALSDQECRTGLVVRWGLRRNQAGLDPDAPERLGADGRPLPPITVPVSALLAGSGGTFRLTDVFGITPRPAPLAGNGNRRPLFPLIGSAVTTSGFGWRLHPMLGNWLLHAGRDLAAPEGTPVVEALSGRVLSSGLAVGYG